MDARSPGDAHAVDRQRAALTVAALGLPVFALRPNGKAPPKGSRGLKDATTDPATIRATIRNGANYGILGGDDVLVLDCDDPDQVDVLEATFPELAEAPSVRTPRGGRHWYLHGDGWSMPTRAKAADGLDVRGFNRAYVVGPGSTVNGRAYEAVRPLVSPDRLPRVSPALREYLHSTPTPKPRPQAVLPVAGDGVVRWASAALEAEAAKVRGVGEGGRRDVLNRAAFALGQIVGGGHLTLHQVTTVLLNAVATQVPPLDADEANRTITDGISDGRKNPRQPRKRAPSYAPRETADALAPKVDEVLSRYADTDAGNAERFAHYTRGTVRYAPGMGWLLWTGSHWELDPSELVLRLALDTIRATHATAALLDSPDRRTSLGTHARASEALGRLRAMLEIARVNPDVHILPDRLDADPWMLNTLNGLVDLRTSTRHPHDPAALCTKIAPVAFDPTAEHPALTALLEVLDRDGRAEYIRDIFGQALTGRSAKAAYVLTGPSGTGKSTVGDAAMAVLGPYAVSVEPSSLVVSKHGTSAGGARADLVALRGARLAIAAEMPNGGRLDAGLVKRFTGRDPITARAPYAREALTFVPGHTLVMHSNHEPQVDWNDDGMRARLAVVPFTVRPDNPDPRIRAALVDDADARAAVLAWAAVGAARWFSNGERLGTAPEVVQERTRELWNAQDPFAVWAEDALVFDVGPDNFAPTADLAHSYMTWCEANGERPLTTRALGQWLANQPEARGVAAAKRGKGGARGWTGLRLRGPTG